MPSHHFIQNRVSIPRWGRASFRPWEQDEAELFCKSARLSASLGVSKWLPEGGARTRICHIFTFDSMSIRLCLQAHLRVRTGKWTATLHQTRSTQPLQGKLSNLIDLGQRVKWWCGAVLSRSAERLKFMLRIDSRPHRGRF
jgi:hypothetical protein